MHCNDADYDSKPLSYKYIDGGGYQACYFEHGDHEQITSVILPSKLKTIGQSAFAENMLSRVTIPSGVTGEGWEAFIDNLLPVVSYSQIVVVLNL